jgi:hypothetical protein|eukprot:20908-Heterococcus_DN1.PRE.1
MISERPGVAWQHNEAHSASEDGTMPHMGRAAMAPTPEGDLRYAVCSHTPVSVALNLLAQPRARNPCRPFLIYS